MFNTAKLVYHANANTINMVVAQTRIAAARRSEVNQTGRSAAEAWAAVVLWNGISPAISRVLVFESRERGRVRRHHRVERHTGTQTIAYVSVHASRRGTARKAERSIGDIIRSRMRRTNRFVKSTPT